MADLKISELVEKTSLGDSDVFAVVDYTASPIKTKKTTWATIKSEATINGINTPTIKATTSAGVMIKANNDTNVALFGAGGGAGVTFYGGVNVSGSVVTQSGLYSTSINIKDNTSAQYGFIGLDSGIYNFVDGNGNPAHISINGLNMQDPTNYGYSGFGYIYLDSDVYRFRNSSENLTGIALSSLKLSDDFAGGLGDISLYDGAYTFLNSLGSLGNISVANLGFDGGYVGQYSSFAYGSAGINVDGTSFFENGNFAFNQYNPQLSTDGISGVYINNINSFGTDIRGTNWSINYEGEFTMLGNSFYWTIGGYLYVQNNITTAQLTAWSSAGIIFKNGGSSTMLTLGASGSINALFAGNIEVSNTNPQLVLTSGTNSATAGLVRWRTTASSEFVDAKFDAQNNIFSFTYGSTTIFSFTSIGTTLNSPSSGTGGVITINTTSNTWTNASLVNKIFNASVTVNQSGTAGFDFIDVSMTQSAVGSGEKNLIRFNKNGTGVFTVDYNGRVAINKSIPATILGMVDIVTDSSLADTISSIVAGKVVTSGISRGASFRNLTGTTGSAMIEIAGISSGSAKPAHILVDNLGDMSIATGSTTYGTFGIVRVKFLAGGNIQLIEDNHIVIGTSSGSKIGTATNQKIGFWNATPVIQQVTNAYTSDSESSAYTGIDNLQVGSVYAQLTNLNSLRVAYENLRASYDDLLTKLKNTGIVA